MHWYTPDGTPAYEIKGANGKMRATTLRDARKLQLVPSVTTVMSIQDKPALIWWKQNQLLEAAIKDPYHALIYQPSEWKSLMLKESSKIGRQAADNGTRIHDSLETAMKKGLTSCEDGTLEITTTVMEFLKKTFEGFEFVAEDSFTHQSGFGGKIDLYGVKDKGKKTERRMVLDFKTKNKTKQEMEKIKAYDDQHLQTAAYVKGLEDTKELGSRMEYGLWERYNLFIGYDVCINKTFQLTGVKLTQSKDFDREWGMFEKLLEFWQLKNSYVPKL
jgi:hypothetical protein